MEAYCVKCKKKVKVKDAVKTKTKKGKPMMKSKCSECGTEFQSYLVYMEVCGHPDSHKKIEDLTPEEKERFEEMLEEWNLEQKG